MAHSLPDTGALAPAGVERRFYAFVLDRILAWLWFGLAGLLALLLFWSAGQVWAGVAVVVVAVLAALVGYGVVLGLTGATPGKAALGLRVVGTEDDAPLGVGRGLLRTALLACSGVPTFGFGLASLAWTAVMDRSGRRQGWHDRVARSWVIDTRPPPPAPTPVEEPPRQVVNLTAMRLVPATAEAPPAAGAGPAPVAAWSSGPAAGAHRRDEPPEGERTVVRPRPATQPRWRLSFDTGEQVLVDGLGLVGRRPEGRPGEDVRHIVTLTSEDLSLSKTHAQFHLAEGVLVVMDRGSTNGSVLIRQGATRTLTGGKPATLLPGDRVRFGDREMTVSREG